MIKHPAVYTDVLIPVIAKLLKGSKTLLDPFGGTGKIALIKNYGYEGTVTCNEIETEWIINSPYDVDRWFLCDAEKMKWAKNEEFDAICTSPTYGNRMADHFTAKDNSKRITYRHYLGRPLNKENTGMMQWGNAYKDKHINVYKECIRVLKKNGVFVLNISNHIRKNIVIDVVGWHRDALITLGMKQMDEIKISTPRMRFGQNSNKRVDYEVILVFEKR